MAWPPTVPPANRTNTTPQADNHPADHNAISRALSDTVNELGPDPSYTYANLTDRLDTFPVRLELVGTGDVTLTTSVEPFRIGPPNGPNLAADRNEIQARDNSAAADLYLNASGGDIHIGDDLIAAAGSVISGVPDVAAGQTGTLISPAGTSWMAARSSGDPNILLTRNGPADATGQPFVSFRHSSPVDEIGLIKMASSSSVAYVTTSDPRLKNNLGPNTTAADRVRDLGAQGFRGTWIADQGQGVEWDMLSSVDIAVVAPYAVSGEADAVGPEGQIIPQQVDYGSLVPLLVAALSQAIDRIAALEAAAG